MEWHGADIVSVREMDRKDIDAVLLAAEGYVSAARGEEPRDSLKGRVLATLFFEASTRTRLSFETAMKRLGGTCVGFADPAVSSQKKGETLTDTVAVADGMADVVLLRHPKEGSARLAAEVAKHPVINGGDGAGEHPTQTLLDLFTIRREKGSIDGQTIVLLGDLKFGRTVHSLATALSHYNCRVVLVAPPALQMPRDVLRQLPGHRAKFFEGESLDQAVETADVLYVTRIQEERFGDPEEYKKVSGAYRVTNQLLSRAKSDVIVMHPLPRLNEIDPEVDASPNARYFQQAANGVPVRMALLELLLGIIEPPPVPEPEAEKQYTRLAKHEPPTPEELAEAEKRRHEEAEKDAPAGFHDALEKPPPPRAPRTPDPLFGSTTAADIHLRPRPQPVELDASGGKAPEAPGVDQIPDAGSGDAGDATPGDVFVGEDGDNDEPEGVADAEAKDLDGEPQQEAQAVADADADALEEVAETSDDGVDEAPPEDPDAVGEGQDDASEYDGTPANDEDAGDDGVVDDDDEAQSHDAAPADDEPQGEEPGPTEDLDSDEPDDEQTDQSRQRLPAVEIQSEMALPLGSDADDGSQQEPDEQQLAADMPDDGNGGQEISDAVTEPDVQHETVSVQAPESDSNDTSELYAPSPSSWNPPGRLADARPADEPASEDERAGPGDDVEVDDPEGDVTPPGPHPSNSGEGDAADEDVRQSRSGHEEDESSADTWLDRRTRTTTTEAEQDENQQEDAESESDQESGGGQQ